MPYKIDKGQWVKFEDTVAGRPLKAPEYVDSFAAYVPDTRIFMEIQGGLNLAIMVLVMLVL